jgi:hypothetical protein
MPTSAHFLRSRRFLARFLALLAVVVATIAVRSALSPESDGCGANLADFPAESVVRLDCAPVFVVNPPGDIDDRRVSDTLVYLAQVPHLPGERAKWDATRRLFLGLHGEAYTAFGEKVAGPGGPRLIRCPYHVDDGYLVLDLPNDRNSVSVARACRAYERSIETRD